MKVNKYFGISGFLFLLCLLMASTNAYAWQQVFNAKIERIGCFTASQPDPKLGDINDCYIKIDINHNVTTSTANCQRKYFAWKAKDNPTLFDVAKNAYDLQTNVLIRYSEFACYATWWRPRVPFMRLIQLETLRKGKYPRPPSP